MGRLKKRRPPKLFVYRGRRIRLKNEYLVRRFWCLLLTPLFLAVSLAFHLPLLLARNWSAYSAVYIVVSIVVAGLACGLVAFLYYFFRYENHIQRVHRQKLARMIWDNGWHGRSLTGRRMGARSMFVGGSHGGFSGRVRRYVRMWYKRRGQVLTVIVEPDMGQAQDGIKYMPERLETGLNCDLIEDSRDDYGYLKYVFLFDSVYGRIMIDKVTVGNGRMRLMEAVYWDINGEPHMIVGGGTGGGKTYFLLSIIYALLRDTDAVLTICDPKNSMLVDLGEILPDVHLMPERITDALYRFQDSMMKRYAEMKRHPEYETGKKYHELGFVPHFLILDEFVSYFDAVGRERDSVWNALRSVANMGREAGFFLILATQRPDGTHLPTAVRDQFNFRVALGHLYDQGYAMMFGDAKKTFFQKPIKGRGYYTNGRGVLPEFFAPFVPEDFKFLDEIRKVWEARNGGDKSSTVLEFDIDMEL